MDGETERVVKQSADESDSRLVTELEAYQEFSLRSLQSDFPLGQSSKKNFEPLLPPASLLVSLH